MMKRYLTLLAAVLAAVSCGGDDPVDPTPTPSAPTSITLSKTSFEVAQAGETLSLDITAPTRPQQSGCPAWITYKDGTYKDYKMTVGLAVAENDTYESRSAEITFSATGVPSVKVTVTQAGKEYTPTPPDPSPSDNEAWKMAQRLGLGWNLGNQFDGYYNGSWAGEKEGFPDEGVWQPDGAKLATQATFDGVKAAGFTSVRIPVSWLRMIGPAPDYKIDETWMNRVYEVAGFAHNAGLNVIVNTHHDENHGVDNDYQWLDIKNAANNAALNEQVKAEIKAVWTQIAQKFADCGDWLILEGFNEINDGGWGWSDAFRANPTRQCDILNEWNQVFVDAVRATGGKNATRWLGVPTYAANPSFEKYFTMPEDPAKKTMLAVHFYDPSDYTIGEAQYSDWGHTGAADKKASYGDEDHVRSVFGNLCTQYVEKNVPVYLGEFGCSMRAQSDTRAWKFFLYYLEYVVKAAKTYGLPCFLWDNGAMGSGQEQHGYINHGTGSYIGNSKVPINVMKKAWFTEADGYTLETVYDSAPKI
jgi:aryl-phospho-beta-D-glucosidase BglC (GH1 family)